MVLAPRPTASNPLAAVRQLMGDFAPLIAQIKHLQSTAVVERRLMGMEQWISSDILPVDVVFDDAIELDLEELLHWISPDLTRARFARETAIHIAVGNMELRVWPAHTPPTNLAGAVARPVLLAVIEPRTSAEAIEVAGQDRPMSVILCDEQAPSELLISLKRSSWVLDQVTRTSGVGSFESWWRLRHERSTEVLRATALCRALHSTTMILAQILEQETRGVRVKRGLLQQQLLANQQRALSPAVSEASSDLRQLFQQYSQSFEKNVRDRLQALIAPPNGSLWLEIQRQVEMLTELTWAKTARSERSGLPPAFQQRLLSTIQEQLLTHCGSDLIALGNMWANLESDLERMAIRRGVPTIPFHADLLDQDACQKLLTQFVFFQTLYRGERIRHGLMEFVMHSRQYQMLALMLFSILGPVGYVIRSQWKIWIPLSIGLLAAGVVSTARLKMREDVESKQRELERASEWILSELRRVLVDFQRAWMTTLTEHITDQSRKMLSAWDSGLRSYGQSYATELVDQRHQLQKQLQSLDSEDRRVSYSIRTRETLMSALSQVEAELRQLLLASVSTPTAVRTFK
jgi:hypothetical protein